MIRAPAELRSFLDPEGRLKQWPTRRRHRELALAWLASHFDPAAQYSEPEVNAALDDLHGFADPAMLRRALFDHGHLDRTRDGARYWRLERPAVAGS